MKTFLTLLIIIVLIFWVTVPAWGDLFTTTAAVSSTQLKIKGAAAPFNYVITGQLVSVSCDGEFDLGVRPGVLISYGSLNDSDFTTLYPRIDWGFQILDYTFRFSEGYQVYVFRLKDSAPASYSYAGFSFGITGQWKLSEMLTLCGAVSIPQTGAFYLDDRNIATEKPVAYSYNYGFKITVLPLVSFTLNTTYTEVGDDGSPFRLDNHGTYFGAVLRW